jgi:uncharacterized protein YxeA
MKRTLIITLIVVASTLVAMFIINKLTTKTDDDHLFTEEILKYQFQHREKSWLKIRSK